MHTPTYRKVIFHVSLLGAAASFFIGFYDAIFGYFFEGLHLLFEMVESFLDKVVEHAFETELHETQLIVFYILLAVGGILLYFLWKVLVHVFKDVRVGIVSEWRELWSALSQDWLALSAMEKLLVIFVFCALNYLFSFFLF